MGIIYSKLWKKLTKEDELKKIVEKMRDIQEFKSSTQLKQKKMVANLILYGCLLYIVITVVIAIWFLPDSIILRAFLLIPLILVPFIIYGMKRMLSWFFDRKMGRANDEMETLIIKKQKVISSIMDTETFNKAKSILALYAPERLDKKEVASEMELRRRNNANAAGTQTTSVAATVALEHGTQTPPPGVRKAQLPLPQPVFPKDRSFGDKLVEFIVGDGPGYRYALICKRCREHNGMALMEEFPYMSFHCCYCHEYNPSKTQRPAAPRLPDTALQGRTPVLNPPPPPPEPGSLEDKINICLANRMKRLRTRRLSRESASSTTPSPPSKEEPPHFSPPNYTLEQFLKISDGTEFADENNKIGFDRKRNEEESSGEVLAKPLEPGTDKKKEEEISENAANSMESESPNPFDKKKDAESVAERDVLSPRVQEVD